jgi:hypothetical protein
MTIETITSVLFDLAFIGGIVAIIWFLRRGLRGGDDYWRQFAEARGYRLTVQHGLGKNRPEPVAELETIMPVMQYKSLAILRPRLIEGMVNGRQFALMELNPTWQRWFFDALRPRGLAVAPSFIFGARVEVRTTLPPVLVMPLAGSKFSYFYPTLPQGYVTVGQWQGHSVWTADKATARWGWSG